MDRTNKKKLKLILIAFVILLIPLFFFIKRQIAIEYQKEAMELFYGPHDNIKTDRQEALKKMNLAIQLAPKNYLFYATKAQMLIKLKQYQAAITELKKVESFKEDYAEGYLFQAFVYDHLQITDSADINYSKALSCYNEKIEDSDTESLERQMAETNRVFILYLTNDSLKAREELQRIKSMYPQDPIIDSLEDFNRKAYLKDLFED